MGHQKKSEEAAVNYAVAMDAEEFRALEAHSHVGEGNTVTTAATSPHAAEAGGEGLNRFDGLLFEEDDYADYIAMVEQEAERDQARLLVQQEAARDQARLLVPRQTRAQARAMARLTAPATANDPFNSTMQAMFTSGESAAIIVGMEEGDDNDWYESIARDAQMMEEMEDLELDGMSSSPLQLPRSQAPMDMEEPGDHHPCAELLSSQQDIGKTCGVHQSELGPDDDEPGPSTKRARVAPLADDEVAMFDCGICLETLPIFNLFHGMPCPHRFCVQCMGTYIDGKVHAGEVPIPCPDPACMQEGGRVLHPEDCKKSIHFATFCSWNEKLAENAIPANRRVYCPNRKCRIMLEKTCIDKTPSMAPCPVCNLPMCATCGLDWSTEASAQHDCDVGPEAEAVKRLATERRWKQCPLCRILVERTMGCHTITCRCGAVFCYTCGLPVLRVLDEEEERCRCRNLNALADLVMQE